MPHSSITTVILAGGAGRRMGGIDKGLSELNGRTMVSYVIERLRPQSHTLVINCNRSQEQYAEFGLPLLSDSLAGGLGPLAGLLTALQQSDSDYVLSVPCDTPLLPPDLVARMVTALEQHGAQACTVDDGERLHPVVLLVRRDVMAALQDYLERGGRKVHDWFHSVRHCSADYSDQPEAFLNINTPQQLEAIQQRLQRRAH